MVLRDRLYGGITSRCGFDVYDTRSQVFRAVVTKQQPFSNLNTDMEYGFLTYIYELQHWCNQRLEETAGLATFKK